LWADHNYAASSYLFQSHNPILIFAAATLGHHALEMYLKSALIVEGLTAFDPSKIKYLDPSVRLQNTDRAWGHDLVVLLRQLAAKRSDFKLSAQMSTLMPWHHSTKQSG
jgi:HEPN domain-containing protein